MTSIIRIVFLYLFFTFCLAGCTTLAPPPVSAPAAKMTWKERQFALANIKYWQLTGKIAVQTAKESGSANVDWLQNQQHFSISLFGPLGTGGLKLLGRPGIVTLETADGKHYSAKNAEQLLVDQWGYRLPVSYLHYWIRGIPVPDIQYTGQFDANSRFTQLSQQGWQVQFLNYTNMGRIDLPNKIAISSPLLNAKIIIYQWKIRH